MMQKPLIKLRDLKELQSSQKQKAELDEFITPFKVKKPRKSRTAKKSVTITSHQTNEMDGKKQQAAASSPANNNLPETPAKKATPATSSRRRTLKSAIKELPPSQMRMTAYFKSCEKTYKIEPLKEEERVETPPTPIVGVKGKGKKSSSSKKTLDPAKPNKTKIGRKRLFVDDDYGAEENPTKLLTKSEPIVQCISLLSDNEEEGKEQIEPNKNKVSKNESCPPNENLNENMGTPISNHRSQIFSVNEPITPLVTSQRIPSASQSGSSVMSSNTISKRKIKPCPPYKVVEGTTFAVDAFQYGYIENVTHYFLTHFHADHYIGLTRKFSRPLYMSKITARLVRNFIPIEEQYIHEMELNVPITVDGVEVVALDANHCPGAIMLFFKIPDLKCENEKCKKCKNLKCKKCKNVKCILHTGDFRAWFGMETEPIFWNYDIHTLYLDTTYISNNYAFCTQYKSITEAKEMVNKFREKHAEKKILFVCGSYVIGKEKFWSALAEEYKLKVWTEENRNKALRAMNIEEYTQWLVDDPHKADMHILAMGKLSYLHLVEHFASYENEYDLLLALRPSGWEKDSKPQYRGKINIIGIEYSEHSSYEEMKRFVKFLKPQKVISTVPVGKDLMRTSQVPEKWYKYEKLQSSSNYQPSLHEYMGVTPKKHFNSKSIRLPNEEMGGVEKFVSPLKKKPKEINNNNNNNNKNINAMELEDDAILSLNTPEENIQSLEINKKKKSTAKKKPKSEPISPKSEQILINNQELKEGEMCSIFIENISRTNSSSADLFESPSRVKKVKTISFNNLSPKEKLLESKNSSDYFEPKLNKTKKAPNLEREIPISQERRITRQAAKEQNKTTTSIPSTISEKELARQIKLMEEIQNNVNVTEMQLRDIKKVSQTNPLLKSNTNTTASSNLSIQGDQEKEEENESQYYKNTNELKLDLMDDNKSELVAASQTTMDLLNTPRPLRNRINYYSISQKLQEDKSVNNSQSITSTPGLGNKMKYAFRWQQEEEEQYTDDIIPASQTSKDLANTPRPLRNKRTASSGSSSPHKMSRQNSLKLDTISEETNETNSLNSSKEFEKSDISSAKRSSKRNLPSRECTKSSSSSSRSHQAKNSNDSTDKKVIFQKSMDTSDDHIPPELLAPKETNILLRPGMENKRCLQMDVDDVIPASQTSRDLPNTPRPIRNKRNRSFKSSSDSSSPPKMSRKNSLRFDTIPEENNDRAISSSSSSGSNKAKNCNDINNLYDTSLLIDRVLKAYSQKPMDTSVDHIPPELLAPIDLDADDDWM